MPNKKPSPKQFVPKEKIQQMADVLAILQRTAANAAKELDADHQGGGGLPLDGWPTMVLGVNYIYRLVFKIAKPTDYAIHALDVSLLDLESTKNRVLSAVEKAAEQPAEYEVISRKKLPPVAKQKKAKE
jgi:hypothetical protein